MKLKIHNMNPIEWGKNEARILDQRILPEKVEWVTVKNAEEMANAIREMVLRGAPLIGIAAAYGLALEAANGNESGLEKAAEVLRNARPTAVNLSWAIDRILSTARKAADEKRAVADAVTREAVLIHEEDAFLCSKIATYGAEILPEGAVLTHCNTGSLATGGEGTAYGAIKASFRKGKISHVFACEARPFLQGARLTAYELKEDGIPFTLLTDSMAGHFLASGKISSVIVGADRIAANGDTANKIGTYPLAVLARENGVPFYIAAPTTTFDFNIRTGKEIPVEERDPREVLEVLGKRVAPSGAHAANPAFDITPSRYIAAIISENGVLFPPFETSVSDRLGENIGAA